MTLTLEVGRISDFTIRPKPNSWPSSPNEYRIFGRNFGRIVPLVRKMLIFEIAQSFLDFYVQEVARLTSVLAESVVCTRTEIVCIVYNVHILHNAKKWLLRKYTIVIEMLLLKFIIYSTL